ncbi:MAG: hypothetical protein KAH20_15670 [Methylococcales bacterium]|nr:hypothetical protein [Methylococcales bacterium]
MLYKYYNLIFFTFLLSTITSHSVLAIPQARLVKDIAPGVTSSISPWIIKTLNVNGTLVFIANDGVHGDELWQSDGTNAGTKLVKDFWPGPQGSDIGGLTQIGDFLFLHAHTTYIPYSEPDSNSYTGVHHFELIKINIITGESVSLKKEKVYKTDALDYSKTTDIVHSPFHQLTNINGTLYFGNLGTGTDRQPGRHSTMTTLWKSDGSITGTVPVNDTTSPAVSITFKNNIESLRELNHKVFFYGSTKSDLNQIWQSDGTITGTSKFNSGFGSFFLKPTKLKKELLISNNSLFFQSYTPSTNMYHLWRSDGTNAGTKVIKNLRFAPRNLTNVDHKVFFETQHSVKYAFSLWVSDGTSSGTIQLKQFTNKYNSFINNRINVNGILYFTIYNAENSINHLELWKSDGTSIGTKHIKDFNISYDISNNRILSSGSVRLSALNNTLFFNIAYYDDIELWKSDGTEKGTELVHQFKISSFPYPYPYIFSNPLPTPPFHLTNVKDKLFFTATDDAHGEELWVIEGSTR